jgi:hypothetical protein
MIYGVDFAAYSEETGMGLYSTCRNCDMDIFDYDRVIIPDSEQFENAIEEDPEGLDIDYTNPVKSNSKEEKEIIGILNDCNIQYYTEPIEEVPVPFPYGVYYHYMKGVIYDNDIDIKHYRYPELDPFNIYINQ